MLLSKRKGVEEGRNRKNQGRMERKNKERRGEGFCMRGKERRQERTGRAKEGERER